MNPGTLRPIYCRNVVAGDEINLSFESLVNTQALLSPLYGSYALQIDVFFAGTSLYVPQLWRNGSMKQSDGTLNAPYPTFRMLPVVKLADQGDTPANVKLRGIRVHPSSLLAYLGYPPGYAEQLDATFSGTNLPGNHKRYRGSVDHNAIPLLMYLDIFRHNYANRQELRYPICSLYPEGGPETPMLQYYSAELSKLDDLFLNLPVSGGDITTQLLSAVGGWCLSGTQPCQGMLLRTFKPDMENVILNDDFFKANVSTVQVSTAGDSFQVEQLVTAKKLWDSRNKDAMSSGTFKDWVRLHYGVTPRIMDDMPTFCGSITSELFFEDIRASATTELSGGVTENLGDKASSGKGYLNSRQVRIVADRPGYVMAIASIVPRVDYSQRLERWTNYRNISDEFRPEYNGIGLQDVLVSDLCASYSSFDGDRLAGELTSDPTKASVGKQPAWIEYMSAVSQVRGTFCNTEQDWVLTRNFTPQSGALPPDIATALDASAYVLPHQWNQAFAEQQVASENFLCQFFIKDFVRSSVAKRIMPHL